MTSPDSKARLDAVLLGDVRRWTRAETAQRAGMTLEQSSRLWHALGFASVADDEVAFTDADVTALANAHSLVAAGLFDPESLQSVTRMVGQSMSRLADWQSSLLVELIRDRPDLVPDGDLPGLVGTLTPALEQVQMHVWRRHLAAGVERLFAEVDPRSALLGVGFADLAGYTSLSRQVDSTELSAVLEEFETTAAELAAAHGGRIVKTIGDEVLFVTATAEGAAELALGIEEAATASDRLPAVRAGLAYGSVLSRFGDVYGPVVNIASRLTGLARPGTVLVDRDLAAALSDSGGYDIRRIRAVPVRGYHHLAGARLRRRSTR